MILVSFYEKFNMVFWFFGPVLGLFTTGATQAQHRRTHRHITGQPTGTGAGAVACLRQARWPVPGRPVAPLWNWGRYPVKDASWRSAVLTSASAR